MALSQFRKAKSLFSRHQPFLALQRFKWSFVEEGDQSQLSSNAGATSCSVEFSKWRKLDSRNLGISRWNISHPSWIVLKNLRDAGFEAYLVGGCVRDLLLNRVPKDFDVITTARLQQVKKKFRRAIIVGRTFPICRVTVKDSVVEVSSFDTVSKASKRKQVSISQMPKGCDPRDFARWENSMNRDFTVNSLFYDPFVNLIFDYTNAMMDLRSLKLRTVIPATLSFKEDEARIFRGLRLAARLNLSFSKETEDALYSLSSSVAGLGTSRIILEMNNMLAYGAAEPSLVLLKKFKLLEILLPFQAAYLSEQADNQCGVRSSMLMKLFFNLDQLITCDQPCPDSLWIAILAFHHAMFSNPQHTVVVLTYALLLYHRTWEESIKFAKERALSTRIYVPEILNADLSDDEIVERVTQFARRVENSVNVLISKDCLLESMTRFPEFPHSALVFVPQGTGKRVQKILDISTVGFNSSKTNTRSREINYSLLAKGNVGEIRFVLGKIILRTLLHSESQAETQVAKTEKGDDIQAAMNPSQKSKICDQIQHKSVRPGKLHTTSKKEYESEKSPDAAANIATDQRLNGKTGSDSSNLCSRDEIVKDKVHITRRPVLSRLFKQR